MRALAPAPLGGLGGGGAILGGLAAKTALTGGALTQLTAACAASVCAVGGFALLDPGALGHHHHVHHSPAAPGVAHSRAGTETRHNNQSSPVLSTTRSRSPGARRSSLELSSSASAAPRAAELRHAGARATKLVSSASIVLTHELELPGSAPPGPPATAAPTPGATPTAPAGDQSRPVIPGPSSWRGWPAHPPSSWTTREGLSGSGADPAPPTADPSNTSTSPGGTTGKSAAGTGASGASQTGTTSAKSGAGTSGPGTGTDPGSPGQPASGGAAGNYPTRSTEGSASSGTGGTGDPSPGAHVGFW